jgi:hypothetical protein
MFFTLLLVVLAQPAKLPPLKCGKGEKLERREVEHQLREQCVRNHWSVRGRSLDAQGRLRSQWNIDDAGVKHLDDFLENGQLVARWESRGLSTLEAAWWPATCPRIELRGRDEVYLPKCAAACDGVDGGARVLVLPAQFSRKLDLTPGPHEGLSFRLTSFSDGGTEVCSTGGRCDQVTGRVAFLSPDGGGLLASFSRPDGGFMGRFDVRTGGVQPFIELERASTTWVGTTEVLVGDPQRLVDALTGKTLIQDTPCQGLATLLEDGSVLCEDGHFVWTRTWANHAARCPEARLRDLWQTDYGPRVLRLSAPRTSECEDVFRGLLECAPGLDE